MPNGHKNREYGGHKYDDNAVTSDCAYACGCWMGPFRSGGPTGLDPHGICPNNPKDGKPLGGTADYDYVVTERIQNLIDRLSQAESILRQVSPSQAKLAAELLKAKKKLTKKDQILTEIRHLIRGA